MKRQTAKRKQQFGRAMLRKIDADTPNLYSDDFRMALAVDSAYRAAADMFQWLELDQIRKPPRHMKDAQLGRQLAIYLMAMVLHMPQRQITRHQGRQRASIRFAIKTIELRLQEARFASRFAQAARYSQELLREALNAADAAGNYDAFTSIAA